MINIVSGNILNAKENIIVHQVNIQGIMGGGVAMEDCIKIKLQINTEKAEEFIKELAEIANKYKIKANIDRTIISFDVADLLEINEIMRLKEGQDV